MDVSKQETVTIFHIRRKDGRTVFLHPFDKPKQLIDILTKSRVEGRYGKEPEFRSFTVFRSKLYKMIDDGLRSSVSAVHVVPYTLSSGAAFLSVYFVTLILLRGRWPMWAGALVAFGAALVVSFVLTVCDMRSEAVLQKRHILRACVDQIYFKSDLFTLEVEHELAICDRRPPERIADICLGRLEIPFAVEDGREARELTAYLEHHFDHRGFREQSGFVAKLVSSATVSRSLLAALHLHRRRPDLALYALYKQIKKSVEAAAGDEGR